jgi:glycine/D-amino acid oxidase-like deaminating enzyme
MFSDGYHHSMQLRYGLPYWLTTPAARDSSPPYPQLRNDVEADVAIVGGGFTGCAAAFVFARAGVRVAVLEQARIGHGSAAASTALLMREPDRYFRELVKLHGLAIARTIWRLSGRGIRDLTATLGQFKCDFRTMPSLHLALDTHGARDLRRDIVARRRERLGGRLLERRALRERTGIDGAAAIHSAGNAVVDPHRATLALAREAVRAGARIFEQSKANRVTPSADGVLIATSQGWIRAQRVIVATGFATPAFKPLVARFKMSTTYVIATSPVPVHLRRQMAGGHLMFWDTERPYHYFRWTEDRRILFGGEDRPVPKGRRARRAALVAAAATLRQKLAAIYPQTEHLQIEYAWDGLFATTPDGLPYIGTHRRYPHHLFALGYGGNGMTFGLLAARLLLRHYLGRPRKEDAIFAFSRSGPD